MGHKAVTQSMGVIPLMPRLTVLRAPLVLEVSGQRGQEHKTVKPLLRQGGRMLHHMSF